MPRLPSANELKFKTKQDGYVNIHPASVNSETGHFASPFLVYQEKVKTSRIFIRDCTMVGLLPLVLFSGQNIRIQMHGGEFVIMLDEWIIMQAESFEVRTTWARWFDLKYNWIELISNFRWQKWWSICEPNCYRCWRRRFEIRVWICRITRTATKLSPPSSS